MNRENEENNPLDEEGDEFIDLEDPNIEIFEEPEDPQDLDDLDEGNAVNGVDEIENEEELIADEENAGGEDLNAVSDREPERDDAFATYVDPFRQPFHAIASHPSDPTLFAVAGEAELIYVIRVKAPDSLDTSESVTVLQMLKGHADTVSLLSFSPNGQWLASGGLDSMVALWSTETWEQKHCFLDLYGEILSLLWHPSSLLLVASCDDAQGVMWNVTKGTVVQFFAGHRDAVTTTIWSSDVKKLLTGSSDGSISVFNPKTGEQEISVAKDLSPDNAAVTALCAVQNDQCVVGCEDGTIHVVSLKSGKVVTHLEELHEQAIECLQYNSNLNLLLSCSCDCKVIVWNTSNFSPRVILPAHESVIPCIWSGNFIIAGCSDGKVRVWDGRAAEQHPLYEFDGHRRMIFHIATSSDGTVLSTASDDGTAKFFRIAL